MRSSRLEQIEFHPFDIHFQKICRLKSGFGKKSAESPYRHDLLPDLLTERHRVQKSGVAVLVDMQGRPTLTAAESHLPDVEPRANGASVEQASGRLDGERRSVVDVHHRPAELAPVEARIQHHRLTAEKTRQKTVPAHSADE